MANEFKIRKGLIVEGASGGTVVDVQGSQGQLFSVTDDLSGEIFAVSDISGVPIFNVNSSGLSTFYGNVNLPDNKKILLGTGSDLEIYHDGSDSYIKDAGTGDLRIVASATKIYDADMSHFQASFTDGGSVDLYYSGNKKFETTNTGVSVTGNGIFTGNVGIGTTSPGSLLHIKGADPILTIQDTSTGTVNTSSTLRLGESGAGGVLDVYWDIKQAADNLNTHLEINHSSNGNHFTILDNGNVGIGTDNPGSELEIGDGTGSPGLTLNKATTGVAALFFDNAGNNKNWIKADSAESLIFGTNNSTNVTIKEGGNVGIGTTSPGAKLDVQPTSTNRKVTRISNDVMSTYFYNTQADAVLAWTCGSYHQAEVVITANQTNGGTTNNLYIRGIWSNNHTSHHWDELEHIGSLTGSTFTISVGQNGSTAASGKLELDFNYISGSFSQLNVRVTDFYGSHSYTIT